MSHRPWIAMHATLVTQDLSDFVIPHIAHLFSELYVHICIHHVDLQC